MNELKFAPRVAPRDGTDALVSGAVGIIQMGALFVLPAWASYRFIPSYALAIGIGVFLYVVFALLCVSHLALSPAGIRFARATGGPKFIPWSEISSIHEVSRTELVCRGWLWPLLPPREMTPTMTSVGHYRIQFGDQWVYFPPADPVAFMATVRQHWKHAPDLQK